MADTNQVRTLSVRQIMDSSDYARGAREFVAANREMSQSSAVIGTIVTQTQVKISNASDGVSRLVRTYDPAAAAAIKFQTEISNLNRALETGKVSADEAGRVYAGIVQKFGMAADGANITAQGLSRLGTVISNTNQQMAEFARASRGIEEAKAELDRMTTSAAALRAQIDPIGTSQARLNSELAEYGALLRSNTISTQEFAAAESLARTRHDQLVRSLNQTPLAGANDNGAQFRRQNLTFQGFDISTSLYGGMSPGLVAAQQAPQIIQGYIGNGGIKALLGDIAGMAGGAARALGPIGGLFGAAAAAAGAYYLTIRDGNQQSAEDLKAHIDLIRAGATAWGDALPALQAYVDRLDQAAKLKAAQDATNAFVSQSFAALPPQMDALTAGFTQANRSLDQTKLPLEKYRELNSAYANLKKDVEANTVSMSDLDRVQRALTDAISSNSTPALIAFQKQWDQITFAIRRAAEEARQAKEDLLKATAGGLNVQDITENNTVTSGGRTYPGFVFTPKNPPIPGFRPAYELEGDDTENKAADKAESAYDAVINAAKKRMSLLQTEIGLVGQATDAQAKLRLEQEMEADYRQRIANIKGADVKPEEIALIKQKADEIARLNQQLAGRQFDQGQKDNLALLQLQIDLIGKSANEQARLNAEFQTNLQLRQQGLPLSGAEADARRKAAVEQAELTVAIQRQQDAYRSLQDAQGSVIDDLLTGTGNLDSRLKAAGADILKFVSQLGANSIKNWLTGTNLPTLADLFSGKPKVPGLGATSTPMMTVTATTVMINGGVTGGIPGARGLLDFLKTPSTNGVRPDAIGGKLINSPVNISAAPTSLSGVDAQVWNYWAAKGLPPHQIAGIMGNINAESAFRPGAIGDNGNAFGLAQWNSRGPAMQAAVPDWRTNVQGQLDFMYNEFQGPEGAAWAKLRSSTNVRDATAAMAGYERPRGYTAANPMGADNWTGRLNAANQNFTKFSANLSSSAKDVSKLGDTSLDVGKHLTDALGTGGLLGKGAMPQNKPANYFPQAPTQSGGFNPFSLFTSIFSLFGFADGTDFAPGGLARINERGAGSEIINLPRGSQVIPAHKVDMALRRSGPQSVVHRYESNIVVSGNGDKELMERMRITAEESVRGQLEHYRANTFNDDVERYNNSPYDRG